MFEFTGAISQLCDGLIAAPQAWKNCVKQSVKNLRYSLVSSFTMILLWFIGDSGRLMYYIYADLPGQFILGGGIACVMDCVVLLQFFFMKSRTLEDVGHPDLVLFWQIT